MFALCHRTSPSAGARSPQSILSKLVLPLPFGPVSWTNVPGVSEKLRPLNNLRSPRTQPSWITSRIVACLHVVPTLLRHCIGLCAETHVVEPQWSRAKRAAPSLRGDVLFPLGG